MKTILIPTDFSDNAGDALAYALNVIGTLRGSIHILNVVDPNFPPTDIAGGNTAILTQKMQVARKSMEALEAYSLAHFGDGIKAKIHITGDVAIGNTAHSIKEAAKTIHADLIIMGTQGINHNALQRVLGTVSTSVLKDAPCPVILVPRGYTFKSLNNVLFSTNLNHADPFELWRAVKALEPHINTVKCLHVIKKEEERNDEHLEKFAKYMVEHSPITPTVFDIELNNDIETAIAVYAENHETQMIIMHRVKQAFWDRIVSASHTKRMASLIKIPLMVMNGSD